MAKKSAAFRMAIALAILFTGVFSLRVLGAIAGEVALEAHSEPVRGKNLVMVDLTLIKKGTGTGPLISPVIEGFAEPLTQKRPLITRGVSFDVMLNGKPLTGDAQEATQSNYFSGQVQVIDLRPGEEWKAVCFLNWEFPLDAAGEYSANVTLSLYSFPNPPTVEMLKVQSNNFSFVIKPLDREGLNKINLADLDALEGKASWDFGATLAALSVAFSEEPSAVQRLGDILGKKTCLLEGLLHLAIELSLERLGDRNAAISCAEGMLRDSSAEVKRIGIHVLHARGSKAEIPALMKLLDKADVPALMKRLDMADKVPALARIQDDEEYNVLWDACDALEKLGGFEFEIPEHCDNSLEFMVAQAKKWWAEKGRLAPEVH